MADNKHKHLDFVQGVINRLAGNSFMVKGWTVTLVAALFAFAASKDNQARLAFVLISYLPVIAFWILDGYFLWQERLFRGVYDDVRQKSDEEIDFKMDIPSQMKKKGNKWILSIFSKTLNIFYGFLLGVLVIITVLVIQLTMT